MNDSNGSADSYSSYTREGSKKGKLEREKRNNKYGKKEEDIEKPNLG